MMIADQFLKHLMPARTVATVIDYDTLPLVDKTLYIFLSVYVVLFIQHSPQDLVHVYHDVLT